MGRALESPQALVVLVQSLSVGAALVKVSRETISLRFSALLLGGGSVPKQMQRRTTQESKGDESRPATYTTEILAPR